MTNSIVPGARRLDGCKPSPADPRDLLLSNYLDVKALRISMDMIPAASDWRDAARPDGRAVAPSRSALGNDKYGDCTLAALAHQGIVIGQITGEEIDITEDDVVDEYDACTEFDKDTGEGDEGWYLRDLLKTSKKRPMFNGKLPPTTAYVRVDKDNPDELAAANFLGVGRLEGFALPRTIANQVDDQGRPLWYIPPGGFPEGKGPGSLGGHAMWTLSHSPNIDVAWSWGDAAWMRADWYSKCCFESWLRISKALLMRNGRIPAGFAWEDLEADVRARGELL